MQRLFILSFVVCLAAGGCSRPAGKSGSQPAKKEQAPPATVEQAREEDRSGEAAPAELDDLVIGTPIRHENLMIFPVSSKVPVNEDLYITLDEGLKAKTIEVYEVGADIEANPPDAPDAAEPEEPQQVADSPDEAAPEDPVAEPPEPEDPQQIVELPAEDPFAVPGQQPAAQEVDGDVNRIMVLNRSDRPLYLMPGEIIYGGKQDRVIADETIVMADKKPVPVNVYCVEQGRWQGRAPSTQAPMLACLMSADMDEETVEKLAAEANAGKFVAGAGSLNQYSRYTVQSGKGQYAVWNDVEAANAAAGVQNATSAFTFNYADKDAVEKLDKFIDTCRPLAEQKQVVGVIVAVNGKVLAADVFQSTPLFRKLWPKLLKSYALDAANAANAASAEEAEKVCSLEDAKEFLDEALQANVEKQTDSHGLVVTTRETEEVVSFSAYGGAAACCDDAGVEADACAAPAAEDPFAAPEAAPSGGRVHTSAFAK